jgi:hypothetical protein
LPGPIPAGLFGLSGMIGNYPAAERPFIQPCHGLLFITDAAFFWLETIFLWATNYDIFKDILQPQSVSVL